MLVDDNWTHFVNFMK